MHYSVKHSEHQRNKSSSDYENTVLIYYSRREAQEEIARFNRKRWVALYCERTYLLQYRRVARKRTPLTINDPENIPALLERFIKLRPRVASLTRDGSPKDVHLSAELPPLLEPRCCLSHAQTCSGKFAPELASSEYYCHWSKWDRSETGGTD